MIAGAGVAGLASALILGRAGHRVTLLERIADPRWTKVHYASPGRLATLSVYVWWNALVGSSWPQRPERGA